MKVVKVWGGLGNQMFQYAFALALKTASNDEVSIDASSLVVDRVHYGYELERVFHVELPLAPPALVEKLSSRPSGLVGRFRRKYLTKRSHVIDRRFCYQPEFLDRTGDVYYEGYWQSEKYFTSIETELRTTYTFRGELGARNKELLASLPRPIASIHVRRGDYLAHPNLDICTPAYYRRATERLTSLGIKSFVVFSDDIPYCKTSLALDPAQAVFVDWNRGADSWQDMALMSGCDHHIIANSSFSWWGAWLNQSPTKLVVAPSIWNARQLGSRDLFYRFTFDDVVPANWLRVYPLEGQSA